MKFNKLITDILKEDQNITKQERIAALKSLQSYNDEYILFIGHSDMGEEYGHIRKVYTAEPKRELVTFARDVLEETWGGLQNEEDIEGEPGNYSAVLGGDDMTYLAVYIDVFIKELQQSEWPIHCINEIEAKLIDTDEFTYEYIDGELSITE